MNALISEAFVFFRAFGFSLPPFASWAPQEFAERSKGSRIPEARLGWDVTDYGQGDFDEMGLLLFTLRNGSDEEARAGGGMCYSEKLLIVREGQVTPTHRHQAKVEDIINRGGSNLIVRLHGSDDEGGFAADRGGRVMRDGVPFDYSPGQEVRLRSGESLTLRPGDWHSFWGDGGDVLIGEVSSVSDDLSDNIFLDDIQRVSTIVEDAAPLRLLVSDYDRWLRAA